jgi:hypothetical protein
MRGGGVYRGGGDEDGLLLEERGVVEESCRRSMQSVCPSALCSSTGIVGYIPSCLWRRSDLEKRSMARNDNGRKQSLPRVLRCKGTRFYTR